MTDTRWLVSVVEDPDQPGELLLDLGQALCDAMGWQVGDELEWVDNRNGSWTIQKTTA